MAAPWVWKDGEVIPLAEANIPIATHSLHYGAAVFEGIRCYDTEWGPAIFRLPEHLQRLFYSASVFHITIPYTAEQLTEAVWRVILENGTKNGIWNWYIRPIVYVDSGLGLKQDYRTRKISTAIILESWEKSNNSRGASVQISRWRRIPPQSTDVEAKIAGNYANSELAIQDALAQGYDNAILLDLRGFVAEGTGENIFVVRRGIFLTPPRGTILSGITRDTILTFLHDQGFTTREEALERGELFSSHEIFSCGTAAEVTPIVRIDGAIIGAGIEGPFTIMVKKRYDQIVHGRDDRYRDRWLTFIPLPREEHGYESIEEETAVPNSKMS